MKRLLWLGSPAAIAAVSLFLSCSAGEPQASARAQDAGTTTAAETIARVRVATRTLSPTVFEDRLVVTAALEAWEDVSVGAEFGGFVREVLFDDGDFVRKDAILARIGDDIAKAQLDQARADQLAADANFTKISKLFERQSVPQQDLVAATSRRDVAAATVREMEIRLERAIVRAPIAGVVHERLVEPGEIASPGALVARVRRVDRLKAVAAVPDTEVAWLEKGREARLVVDAYPQDAFQATLHLVAPAADEETRTFDVEFSLDNASRRLRPGMVGRLEMPRRMIKDAIVVDLDALVTRESGPAAFIIEECIARERAVRLDGVEGRRGRVVAGLAAGDVVVVSGQRDLIDGQPVSSEACR